jgi:hypothetical protein
LYRPVRHCASKKFWHFYEQLPDDIQQLADRCYEFLKRDPQHASLHFKKVGRFWSARVGIHYRAVAVQEGDDFVWFWIGRHDEYDLLIGARH